MDETEYKRKRESTGSFISKKQALQNQEDGEQSPFSIETRVVVLLEQKKALLNAFEQQKLEISDLTYSFSNVQTKKDFYEGVLEKSLALWNQLEQELEQIVSKLGQDLPSGHTDRGTLSLYNSDLSTELLEKKRERLSALLQTVHYVTDNYQKTRHSALSSLTQDPDIKAQNLASESDILRRENAKLTSHIDDYSYQLKSLTSKYNEMNSTHSKLRDRITEYETQLSDLKNTLQTTSKKLHKLEIEASEEAKYLRKIQQEANERENASNNNNNNNNNSSTSSGNTSTVSPKLEGNNNASNNVDNSEELKNLQQELSDLKYSLQNRNNQLSQIQEEKLELMKENIKLKEQASSKNIPEEVVQNTDSFKRINDKYLAISSEYEILKQYTDKLKQDFFSQRDFFKKEREKSDSEEKSRRDKLESALRDEQLQVVKLKGEIESLSMKLEINNSSTPSKLLEELKLIISARENDIKKLKEQNEKYREDSNKLKTFQEDHKKNTEKLHDQIDYKTHELKEAQNKIKEFKVTIEEYVSQKKQWEEKTREFKLLLETYQSQAKDKRDVKEIRLSEKKLQEEIGILKEKLDKFEREPLVIQIKELEDKHAEEIENIKKEYSIKLFNAEKSIKQHKALLEEKKQEFDEINTQLEEVNKMSEDFQDQNTRLTDQLREREDTLTKITSDQIKATLLQSTLNLEKQALVEKLTKCEEKYVKQQEANIKIEQKSKLQQDQIKKQTDELRLNMAITENLKVQYNQSASESATLKSQLDRIAKEKQEENTKANNLAIKLEKETYKCQKLEEEAQLYKRRIDRMLSKGSGFTDEVAEEELRVLKHKTTCGVCNDKPKDTVIARCFHTFCSSCVRKNLEVRSRKCPACGKSFDQSDVHSIYL